VETKVWLPIALSSLSLVVSGISLFISFWRGRYRLKISSKIATLVTDTEDPQNVLIVEVANNGGESAEVGDVFLKQVDGPGRALTERLSSPGAALPVTLAARGGRESWYFGYDELKRQARNRVADTPLTVRATVRVGSKNHSQRRANYLCHG